MKTVLIADDNAQNLYFLELLLKGNGFEIVSAPNGAEALALANKKAPDLVISDILMPVMDGWTLCREWKSHPVLRRIPFIFYTATYTEAKDEEFALKLGADRFVTKPQDPEELMGIINSVMADSTASSLRTPVLSEELRNDYSEALFRKLQKKVSELELTNMELHRTVEKLQHAEDELTLLGAAVAAAPTAVVITDAKGNIEWVNPAFTLYSGYSSGEAIGRNPRFLKSGMHTAEFYAELWRTISAGKPWYGEIVNKRKDGGLYTEDVTIAPVKDYSGTIRHFVALKLDVTERKELEQKYLRAQRLESIGMLAAGIAHDLNNVLAPVLMAAPVLRERATDSHDISLLTTIEESAARGAGLIRQILDFARGIGGNPQLVQIKHLIRDISSIIRQTFPRSIVLEEDFPEELWPIQAFPTQIHQVLLNLCINARDAMPKGGTIRICAENCRIDEITPDLPRTAQPGTWLLLKVEDNGTGISPELINKIWDPFFSTKPKDKGTGLGLATVRGIIETHHGFVTVKSTPGVGTSFWIYLPAVVSAPADSAVGHTSTFSRGRGEFVLLADDEKTIRDTASSFLTRQGYQVLTASDGLEATMLFVTRAAEISLVITDLDMPMFDGEAFIGTIRRLNPEVRVIVMTGMDRDGNSQPLAEDPSVHYLSKPFSAESLLTAVQQLIPPEPVK